MTTRRTFIAVHIFFAALATVFVGARFGAKWEKRLAWLLDDTLLLLALGCMYALFAGAIVSTTVGRVCAHQSTVTAQDLEETLLIVWILQFPHFFALTFIRCAILIFFIRTFFTHMHARLRVAAYCCLAISFAWFVTTIVLTLVHCRPIQQNWTGALLSSRHCLNLKPWNIVRACWSMVLDASIWSLPHFVVWKLQLPQAHKVAVAIIFALGLLNIVVAAVRINSLSIVSPNGDLTYDASSTMMTAYAQVSTAVILACCPLLRPVFNKLVPTRLIRIRTSGMRLSSRVSGTRMPRPKTPSNPSAIRVTTRVQVHDDSNTPPGTQQSVFQDGFADPYGPTFHVSGEKETNFRQCV